MEASDDDNGPKRRVWRRLGPRLFFFFFLRIFLILTNVFLVYIACRLHNTRQAVRWKAATTKTGSNDASGVVWAISKLFFFFFHVVSILTTTFRYYMWFKEKEWPREGIDDRKRAISIFVFFCVLSILTIIFKLPPRPPPTRLHMRRWCFFFFFL